MDTRSKSHAEFCNEVHEILGRHESSFDQVNTTLQVVLTELQALRTTRHQNTNSHEINPSLMKKLHPNKKPLVI